MGRQRIESLPALTDREAEEDGFSPEKGSPTSLGDVLDDLFRHGVLPFSREDLRIWDLWPEAVGPIIAESARPCWIKNGVLRVLTDDSIWLQELKYQEQSILERLNALLGRRAVSKIEFKMALR
jgi:predicted nucleic acid-binding Zn ribbon protein